MGILREISIGDFMHPQYVFVFKSITSKEIESESRKHNIDGKNTLTFVCRGRTKVKENHLEALNILIETALPRHTKRGRMYKQATEYVLDKLNEEK